MDFEDHLNDVTRRVCNGSGSYEHNTRVPDVLACWRAQGLAEPDAVQLTAVAV